MTTTVDSTTYNILLGLIEGYEDAAQIVQYPGAAEYRASTLLNNLVNEILTEVDEPPVNMDEWQQVINEAVNRLDIMLDQNEILVIG